MEETYLTLPMPQGLRKPTEQSIHWKTIIASSFKAKHPWHIDTIRQIIEHQKTEDALFRLIKESNGKFSVDTFCDILATCRMYLFSKGYDANKRPTISWDKKEFRRMAENSRELHNKINKILNVMDRSRAIGKPLCKGDIELFTKGNYRDADLGGDQLDDKKIFYALDIANQFMAKLAEPKPKHRPSDIYLDQFMFELEHKFRTHCNGRPLYPVISDLVQATTDVLKAKREGAALKTSPWTAGRVITRLKRFYRSKENEDYIKRSKESWVKTPRK